MKTKYPLLLFFLLIIQYTTIAQKVNFDEEIKTIENFLIDDQVQQADSVLSKIIETSKLNKWCWGLSKFIYWKGKVELATNEDKTFPEAIKLSGYIKENCTEALPNYQTRLDLSRLYNEIGNLTTALEIGKSAMGFALETDSNEAVANCHYYLGEYSLRSGNINPFFENIKKGHRILLDNPNQEFKISSRILNYMGAIKYFSSEPDSAYYFYDNALKKIGEMEDNSENRLYFPAAIRANMVLLKQSQNKFDEALSLAEECILLNKEFLASSKKHPLRFRSQRNLSLAYRNLCSLYEQIGDYDKSYQIAEMAYNHAKHVFEPQLLEHFSAVTLLAEAKISKRNFDGALKVLQEAKKSLNAMEGEKPLLEANYYTILGAAHYGNKDFEKARNAYQKGNEFHLKAKKEVYSSDRLFAIINLALSQAQLGNGQSAYKILEEAYQHQIENGESGRLMDAVLMAKARVANILNDNEGVIKATSKFFQRHKDSNLNKASYAFKAEAIALNAKSKIGLQSDPNIGFLENMNKTLTEAISILEQRKAFIASKENINTLIAENEEVFDLAKKINLKLYQKTNDNLYLEKVLSLHESSIYNKIRSRLNLKNVIGSFGVSEKISEREHYLKAKLNENANNFTSFYEIDKLWVKFLDSLKIQHHQYYQMRYATLLVPLDKLQQNIPATSTLIRYFYIDQDLFAYVATNKKQHLVQLDILDETAIAVLGNFENSIKKLGTASNSLYGKLWAPIAPLIDTEEVVIFPDKSLFNLSFELLSPRKIHSYRELWESSLLAKHTISYNYSLLLQQENERLLEFEKDFVAFAPSFDSDMKKNYVMAIHDSILLDKSYMTLLPQPFSSDLALKFGEKFGGNAYLNQNASKQVFKNSANEHKIIHIGTHAESNNVNPELSRLVFAKNVSDSTDINDNYLYTYEIYNQNLNSNLAILTGCETGKPAYQPGEGMISLAHAFNYAGSESILTSLWKIDEQSSTQILEYFYEYLEDGLPKNKALRNAKLDYLKKAEGRTLHPQYWAGLILMGDTNPIGLDSPFHWWVWVLAVLAIALLIMAIAKKKSSII